MVGAFLACARRGGGVGAAEGCALEADRRRRHRCRAAPLLLLLPPLLLLLLPPLLLLCVLCRCGCVRAWVRVCLGTVSWTARAVGRRDAPRVCLCACVCSACVLVIGCDQYGCAPDGHPRAAPPRRRRRRCCAALLPLLLPLLLLLLCVLCRCGCVRAWVRVCLGTVSRAARAIGRRDAPRVCMCCRYCCRCCCCSVRCAGAAACVRGCACVSARCPGQRGLQVAAMRRVSVCVFACAVSACRRRC
eukprot:COSAG01_NODE_3429_length_6104_cov_67.418748_2_plen_246_part_00